MGFTNKVTKFKNGDIVDIGQYRYTFHHIVSKTNNKDKPTIKNTKYWSVTINTEYLKEHNFNPDELPLGKVGKYSVTKFAGLYSHLGYQKLIRFNSNKIREQHKKPEVMMIEHLFDDINCDILDLRECEPGIFVKTQSISAGEARVIIADYDSLENFKKKYWCNFDNLVINRTVFANTDEIKLKLENLMFTEEVKVKHISSIEKFISKVKMLRMDNHYLLVV